MKDWKKKLSEDSMFSKTGCLIQKILAVKAPVVHYTLAMSQVSYKENVSVFQIVRFQIHKVHSLLVGANFLVLYQFYLVFMKCRTKLILNSDNLNIEHLITGFTRKLDIFYFIIILSSSHNTMHSPSSWSHLRQILASQTACMFSYHTSCCTYWQNMNL